MVISRGNCNDVHAFLTACCVHEKVLKAGFSPSDWNNAPSGELTTSKAIMSLMS